MKKNKIPQLVEIRVKNNLILVVPVVDKAHCSLN
jgi:hypothetical protein